ncbi:MAG: DUF6941 family protein [Planctomycetota bacterium]|jgi:hypothetical protein
MSGPKPEVKAFLLCDYVLQEAGTHKKSLIGIFEQVNSATFPFRHGRISVYANLADAHGSYELMLRLVRLRDGKVLLEAKGLRISVSDPLSVAEVGGNLDGIVFEDEGKYEFAMYANDQFLQSKPFQVRKSDAPSQQQQQQPPAE